MPISDGALTIGFTFESLDGLIGDRGSPIMHYLAVSCTCMNVSGEDGSLGHADPTCDKCYGTGIVYRDPVIGKAIIDPISANRIWSQQSWIQPGDISMMPPTYFRRVGNFDKILVLLPVPVDSQVLYRGVKTQGSPRPSGLLANEDYLYWESGREQARWLEDEDGKTYLPGEYLIQGHILRWSDNGGPGIGKKYVISYEAYPEYIMWTMPTDIYDLDVTVGQMIMGRRVVMQTDPSKRQIEPPWYENVVNAPSITDNPYPVFSLAPGKGVSPSR